MASKKTIRKFVWIAVWVAICGGLLTLLLAANGKKKDQVCSDVAITIRGTGESYFIGKSDIAGMLRHAHKRSLKGAFVNSINLAQLEQALETNAWIQDAELYFDSRSVLHVTITERQPVVRVFTTAGSSFYMDSAGVRLPLLPKISARVPVVTNFPAAKKLNAQDSAVLLDIKSIVRYITGHPFWNAQIAQVDVQPNRTYELLPVVGNHVIRIGSAEKLDEKLHRLLLLYQQVLSKTGFDAYSTLDVQFEGQVVAVRKEGTAVVDSTQLQKNIEELLQTDQMMAAHKEGEAVVEKKPVDQNTGAVATVSDKAEKPAWNKAVAGPKPVAVKNTTASKPVEKQKTEKEERKPKAVMPRRG